MLAEGRGAFGEHRLSERALVEEDRDIHAFLWRGSQTTAVFAAALAMAGLAAEPHDFGITMPKTTAEEALPLLLKSAEMPALDPIDVAAFVGNIKQGKYAAFVPDAVARRQWARRNAHVIGEIPAIASSLLR
jgi:ATP-dependent Lhr-like helicase